VFFLPPRQPRVPPAWCEDTPRILGPGIPKQCRQQHRDAIRFGPRKYSSEQHRLRVLATRRTQSFGAPPVRWPRFTSVLKWPSAGKRYWPPSSLADSQTAGGWHDGEEPDVPFAADETSCTNGGVSLWALTDLDADLDGTRNVVN